MKTAFLALGSILGLALVAAAACSDPPTPQICTDIPAGGCPLSMGVACDDPSCVAAYACNEGNVWTLDHVCPVREAGADADADLDAADADAALVFDASIDAPPGAYGGPGCDPLEMPDCTLGFALSCPAASQCCDCEDLFVCDNGGWSEWGTCSVDAGLQKSPVP